MSLLPTFIQKDLNYEDINKTDIPVEFGIDFNTGLMTGEKVSGKEAIKVWIWHCLKVERFKHAIYTWAYGVELEEYIGESYSQEYLDDSIKLAISEAFAINPYITSTEDITVALDGDLLSISATVNTTFGEVTINV